MVLREMGNILNIIEFCYECYERKRVYSVMIMKFMK